MYSIGVDIGTGTTEIIISHLEISIQLGASLLPETKLEKVTILYKSPVIFTPFISDSEIDFLKIKSQIKASILKSGLQKNEIETGAVIITGETARKENAASVGENLSEYLGDFVVALAGPDLEAILAAQGAGMKEYSKKTCKRVMNLDIGGGTLNAALFDSGNCIATYAMDIGGRLVLFDENGRITYLSKRIDSLIKERHLNIKMGEVCDRKQIQKLCEALVLACYESIFFKKVSAITEELFITKQVRIEDIDYISFSGGVGEYVREDLKADEFDTYWSKSMVYGDIGPVLGYEIRKKFQSCEDTLIFPKEKIRATVIGTGNCSLSVSGSTVGFEESILPMKNIPIIKPHISPKDWAHFYEKAKHQMQVFEEEKKAVYIEGEKSPGYEQLKILALELAKLYEDTPGPLIILMKEDFAKALRQILAIHTDCQKPIICLDKIDASQGDYIDIGKPIGSALPVVIKTLIYET